MIRSDADRRVSRGIFLAVRNYVPLPISREINRLTALHRQRGYAAHLIAIENAAVVLSP
jgi:hypothetical protein